VQALGRTGMSKRLDMVWYVHATGGLEVMDLGRTTDWFAG